MQYKVHNFFKKLSPAMRKGGAEEGIFTSKFLVFGLFGSRFGEFDTNPYIWHFESRRK